MASKKEGVLGKMIQKIPYLIGIHCFAHRNNLILKDIGKVLGKFEKFQTFIYKLISFFNDSSKRSQVLRDFQKVHDDGHHYIYTLIHPYDIR